MSAVIQNPRWTDAPYEMALIDRKGKPAGFKNDVLRFEQKDITEATAAMRDGQWEKLHSLSIPRFITEI